MEQGLTYLEAVQKLFEKTEIEYSFGEKGIASKPSYVYPKREENNDMTKVIEYWGKRGISEKTLKYADIQADKFGNTVFNYYNDSDVLMNVKYRPSHKIQKGEAKCWFQKGTSFSPILFNMNKCDPSKPLYIQEGEGDIKNKKKVIFPKNMNVVFPKSSFKQYKVNYYTVLTKDNDDYKLTNKNLNYRISNSFLYDGNDLYFFITEGTVTFSNQSIKIPPMSYVSYTYGNGELYIYNYDEDKVYYYPAMIDGDVIYKVIL